MSTQNRDPAAGTQASAAALFERSAEFGNTVVSDEAAAKKIAVLRARFAAATDRLRNLRFAGSDGVQRSVHELPWYALIGAPGSGNSTALRTSGLRFPQLVQDGGAPVTGVGGTRYCEWWFSDEAVLLDTAGRYVAHESKSNADSMAGTLAWHEFLELLKQSRPTQPLNGAIVTVSVSDLLLWSKPERRHFGAHVRMRLAELYAGLDAHFPVYMLVTKMDLLAGFSEFFASYDANARAQVWGTTFQTDVDPIALSRTYPADFSLLQARLYAEMLARLEEEPDLARRAAIYRFPQQFHALGPLLHEFLGMAFSTQVDYHPLMLRGVYFASAAQAGKPIDRVMRTLERAFKLEHQENEALGAEGATYFMDRLLHEVIFPEAGLAARIGASGTGVSSLWKIAS